MASTRRNRAVDDPFAFYGDRPFFRREGENKWPWLNCTKGNEQLQKRYSVLVDLQIPLGDLKSDQNVRQLILGELMALNEEKGLKHEYKRLNHLPSKSIVKLPTFNKHSRRRDFEDFFTQVTSGWSINGSKEGNLQRLLLWIAKEHKTEFYNAVESARVQEKKRRASQPFRKPEDLVMYDGGDPDDAMQAKWNDAFGALKMFKEKHGHVLVSCRRTPDGLSPDEQAKALRLGRWAAHQRTCYREKNPVLTPKRIELLEGLGFVWAVSPNQYSSVEDPKFHASWAAKLFFSEKLTARDAMFMSGFPEEEAANDSRKKMLNNKVCCYYKKHIGGQEAVEVVLKRLRESYVGNELPVLRSIFERSDFAEYLLRTNKLVPRENQGPALDASTSSPEKKRRRDKT